MKKVIYILSIVFVILTTNSCYDRDIIDSKDGVILPEVTDLKSTIANSNEVTLTWSIPSSGISDEVARPLSVYIQVYRGAVREYQISLTDEPVTWKYTLAEPTAKYRIVVKMQGKLKEKSYGKSDEIYSLGQTVGVN